MTPTDAAKAETALRRAAARRRLGLIALALALALFRPGAVPAQPGDGVRIVRAPIVHNWLDPGGVLSVQTAYGNFYVPTSVGLPPGGPADGNLILARVLLTCSSGAPVTLLVSAEDPERIVGIEDFAGRLWLAEPGRLPDRRSLTGP